MTVSTLYGWTGDEAASMRGWAETGSPRSCEGERRMISDYIRY